ncbi:MAG: DUF4149 domain-containing protein [Thiohalomonadaceae bacterium]
MRFTAAGERILLTLWVGALWSVGYLAVPVLFAQLDDRMLAGMLAGHMFTLVAWLGLIAGALLAMGELVRSQGRPGWRFWVLAFMLALVAVGHFGLQPAMAALKVEGLPAGSAQAAQFARLHGFASVLYLLTSLAGLALVAGTSRCGREA